MFRKLSPYFSVLTSSVAQSALPVFLTAQSVFIRLYFYSIALSALSALLSPLSVFLRSSIAHSVLSVFLSPYSSVLTSSIALSALPVGQPRSNFFLSGQFSPC